MDDSRGSRVDAVRGVPNAATQLRMAREEPRLAAGAVSTAWSQLVGPLALVPAASAVASYRLFWTGCGENGFRDFPLTRGAHLVVGRHAACDVVLAGDAELSLRHLLVLPARGAGDAPALRIVDLQGSLPMHLEDDSAQRSLHVEGPFALRLGRYVLGGFAIGGGAEVPPDELPRAQLRDDVVTMAPLATQQGGPYRAAAGRVPSVVTSLPRPTTMIEEIARAAQSDAIALLGAARDGERVRITVGREALQRGVLVGRADKCDPALKALLTIRVSRVHAVVIEVEGQPVLFDCASTNGTFASGRQVRSLVLENDPPVVQLAGSDGVELRWTALRR